MSQGEYTHSSTVNMTPQTTATSIARTVALDTCIAPGHRERRCDTVVKLRQHSVVLKTGLGQS